LKPEFEIVVQTLTRLLQLDLAWAIMPALPLIARQR